MATKYIKNGVVKLIPCVDPNNSCLYEYCVFISGQVCDDCHCKDKIIDNDGLIDKKHVEYKRLSK